MDKTQEEVENRANKLLSDYIERSKLFLKEHKMWATNENIRWVSDRLFSFDNALYALVEKNDDGLEIDDDE